MLRIFKGEKESVLASGNVIVVDILCATSVMLDLFKRGANSIIPISDIKDVIYFKNKYKDHYVIGDFAYQYPEIFDVNIFERESYYNFDPKDKNIIYVSYNGTKRINQSLNAKQHFIGSFNNFSALLKLIKEKPYNYCFLLAMSDMYGGDEDIAYADMLNFSIFEKDFDRNKIFSRVLQSKVALEGTLLLRAPYLIEMAIDQDNTEIVPVSYIDEKTGFLTLKPLSEI